MGFETISFARINDEEKRLRKTNREMEFLWRPRFEGPDGAFFQSNRSIFVHTMHELYNAPCGMDQYQGQMSDNQSGVLFEDQLKNLDRNNQTYVTCLRDVST
jgi:hypothetical protein